MIEEFPKYETLHPFYADLINVLYDRDHYKLALGQLNISRQIIGNIGKDYVKLLKYGDSLYRCKQLKRAALGRMVKVIRQQKAALAYLEQVRQHMSRLPSIDPSTRTLLLCGFPNVGKSSIMNTLSRANVEVQNYAFTTKSLYVGHFDYDYLRWQIIDSPGVLDRPLEERNTIEMQAITAMAHLNAYLFASLSPLFVNKPIVVVLNKCDLRSYEGLNPDERECIDKMLSKSKNTLIKVVNMSALKNEGVIECRNTACDMLLSHRIELKAKSNKLQSIEHRLFVATPEKRDDIAREPDLENEWGGPGVFHWDTRNHWQLENDEWKFDKVPEIFDGKNVSDFYSPDVGEKLQKLEAEERQAIEQDFVDEMERDLNSHDLSSDDDMLFKYIRRKQTLARMESAHKKTVRNHRPVIARPQQNVSLKSLNESLSDLGVNTSRVSRRVKFDQEQELAKENQGKDMSDKLQSIARGNSRTRSKSREPRPAKGISSIAATKAAQKLKQLASKSLNKKGFKHESDRLIPTKKPKFLYMKKQGKKKNKMKAFSHAKVNLLFLFVGKTSSFFKEKIHAFSALFYAFAEKVK
ncbi:hypothetical protein RFI_19782 [Reticulomyxa filosa]|uniref:Nucleolar GTP-binding protein 1 n=1 Tax=Reticulomyxa filosa TaxID=46433 RepID=X6MUN7_RETFI|nr:hypothetical protein RFI_19782 [Reticulomyxa filosa]|eukprot:ETO17539.1 hypothetical protein RFI_19782 [Reticulomyxa filosa]